MITNIFINKILFEVEIILAELVYTIHLKKRKGYAWRMVAYIASSLVCAGIFPAIDNGGILYSSFMFLCLFLITIPLLKLCYDESWINLLFCGIAAYTTQHLGYLFTNLVNCWVVGDPSFWFGFYGNSVIDLTELNKHTILNFLIRMLCSYIMFFSCYLIFGKQFKNKDTINCKSVLLLFIIGIGLVVDIVLNNMFLSKNQGMSSESIAIVTIYACMSCILLLVVQFELLLAKQFQNERDLLQLMWDKEKEQYKLTKENIDIINLKCHDIKHQIRNIGKSNQIAEDVVQEIENAVAVYDASIQTGNEILDIILSEKSLLCYKSKIIFSCIVDGKLLSFMKTSDIYSLFGNAMDNAVEATIKLENEEKRVISILLHKIKNAVSLNISNTFSGDIFYENGEIITTKENKYLHGFGMRIISAIVKNYNGDMHISINGNTFNLNILFVPTN